MVDVSKVEERIDRQMMTTVEMDAEIGGVRFTSMGEVMEFAKLMAVAGAAVPRHLRGNVGLSLAVAVQALDWGMSPFAVAAKSYVASNKGDDRLAFESQLVHAVIEARAPLKGRLRYEITGKDDDRRCRVWGTFKGEDAPHEYVSETLDTLRGARGKNDRGQVKGSPLWQTQPEVQLFYSASRQWCRMYAPDVLLGIYTPDELDDDGPRDVTPEPAADTAPAGLAARLAGASKRTGRKRGGFDPGHVHRETEAATTQTIEGEVTPPADTADDETTAPDDADGGNDEPGGDANEVTKED